MEGLAKSAPIEGFRQEAPTHKDAEMPLTYNGVPLDIIRHFGVDIVKASAKDFNMLKETYDLLDGADVGDKMQHLKATVLRLGSPGIGETLYSRVWQHLKIQKQINSLLKQQHAMEYGV